MFERHQTNDWIFKDGTSLATYRDDDVFLYIYYDDDGVFAFSINRSIGASGKLQSTSWHREHGFSDTIATPGPDPDLGQIEPCEPADRKQLAELIRGQGGQLPERFRSTILQVLEAE